MYLKLHRALRLFKINCLFCIPVCKAFAIIQIIRAHRALAEVGSKHTEQIDKFVFWVGWKIRNEALILIGLIFINNVKDVEHFSTNITLTCLGIDQN